jgi:putative MATE family efflux protein
MEVSGGDPRSAGAVALPPGVTEPIPRELTRLALPVFASLTLRLAYQWVDALWVRGLGVEATAAVTTSIFVMWTVYSLNDIFAVGVTAYVSQLLGAGDRERAGLAAFKGLRASALLGLVVGVGGVLGARSIYHLMTSDSHVLENGTRYLSVVLGAAPLPMIALTCESIMRASGDTRTPLLIDLSAVALNALLDPFLIYGFGSFHGMGVAGAAWATVIAQAVMVVGYLTMAARGHRALPIARRAPGAPVRIMGMARVGLPVAAVGAMFSVVYIAFAHATARYGAASLAIIGIANRIEALQFVGAAAIGIAGATLVGQNLGAGRPERASLVLRTGLGWGVWLSLGFMALFLLAPQFFLSLFTRDAEALRLGVPYLRVLSICLPFVAIEIITMESIVGSGHTGPLSWIYNVISLLRIPLAFVVAGWRGAGVVGIAWLITITCVVRTILIASWAMRGTWKRGLARELRGATSPIAAGDATPRLEPGPIDPPAPGAVGDPW